MSSNYSSEFKQDAVKLAVESDQSVAPTARDLGVNVNTLYNIFVNLTIPSQWLELYRGPYVPQYN